MKIKNLLVGLSAAVATFTSGVCVALLISVPTIIGPPLETTPTANTEKHSKFMPLADGTGVTGRSVADKAAGRYYLLPSFEEEFADFEYFEIPFLISGQNPEATASFNFSRTRFDALFVDENRIVFQTKDVGGERYVFMGTFREVTKCSISDTTSRIEGYLAKFSQGKFIASMNASFYLVYGC